MNYKEKYLELRVEKFNPANYEVYKGRIIGATADDTKAYIDMLVILISDGFTGEEVTKYLIDRFYTPREK